MKLFLVYIIINWWSFLVALDEKGERMACSLMLNRCWLPYMKDKHKGEQIKNVIKKGIRRCGRDYLNREVDLLEKYANTLREFMSCNFAGHVENLLVSFDILKYEHFVTRENNSEMFSYIRSNEDWDNWWALTEHLVVNVSTTMAMWNGTFKMLEDDLPGFKDNVYLMQATNLLSRLADVDEKELQAGFNYGQHKFTRMEMIQTSVRSATVRYFKANCSLKWSVNPASIYKNYKKEQFKISVIDEISVITRGLEFSVTDLGLIYSSDEWCQPRYELTTYLVPFMFVSPGSKNYWLWDGIKKEAKLVRKQLKYYSGDYYKLKHYPVFSASTIMATFYEYLYSYLRIYIDKLMTDESGRFGYVAGDDPINLSAVRQLIASISKLNGNGTLLTSLVQISNRIENPTNRSDTLTAVDLSLIVKVQLNVFDHLLEIQFFEDTQDTPKNKISDIDELKKYETFMSRYITILNRFVKNYFYSR